MFAALLGALGVCQAKPAPIPRHPPAVRAPAELSLGAELFAGSKFGLQAFRSYRSGRFVEARRYELKARGAEPSAAQIAALDLLGSLLDVRRGWLQEAYAGFELAMVNYPELTDFLNAQWAISAEAAEDFETADARAAVMGTADARFVAIELSAARRAMLDERPAEAVRFLDRAEPAAYWAWNRARIAKWRADAMFAIDRDHPAYLNELARIWRRWPKTGSATEAEALLIEGLADRSIPAPLSLDEAVDRAIEHSRKFRRLKSRAMAKAIRARFGDDARGLRALLTLYRYPKKWGHRIIKEADQALLKAGSAVIRDRLMDRRAFAWRGIGRPRDALVGYERLAAEAGTPARGAQALTLGLKLARKMGLTTEARHFSERLVTEYMHTPGAQNDLPLALWTTAWTAYLDGQLTTAEMWLQVLIDRFPSAEDHSRRSYYERALYWQARIWRQQGRKADASRRFRFVMSRFPASYYATLARNRVDAKPIVANPARSFSPLSPWQTPAVSAELAGPLSLYRLGLTRQAQDTLRQRYNLGLLDNDGIQLLSAIYRERGSYWKSHWVVQHADALDVDPNALSTRHRWLNAYPRPWKPLVKREGKHHEIDPLLIYAVMRQESAFRVRARSSAKAIGLMQVLYPTAKLTAWKYLREKRVPTEEDVYSKAGNVHYGAAYLKHQINRYEGNLALALAAYNAGPGNVDRWLLRFGQLPTDAFVENIPFNEARGYVRKVLRSYAAYRTLYGPTQMVAPWVLPRRLPIRSKPIAVVPASTKEG